MRKAKPMSVRKKILWSVAGLVLIIFGFTGYYVYSLYSFADNINKSPEDSIFSNIPSLTKTSTELEPPKWEGKERVNILLLGGDSRGMGKNEIPRSDSLMIASLDPVTKKSYLFSILRDTYVDIPGQGSDRINAAIARGGPELAMKTVSNLMGIPIQYFVYTDFKGFIALVDALGGIELEVEKDMYYTDSADDNQYDINLKKGYQHLDGNTALQYVRFRHDATSDFTRTERQRKFMQALAEKLQSTTSLLKLPSILSSIDPYIETNLHVNQMIKLASLGFEVKTDGMVSQQIPPMDLLQEKRVGGAEVLGVDEDALKIFVKQLFGDVSITPSDKPISGGKLSQGADTTSSGGGTATSKPTTSPKATVKPKVTVKPTVKPTPTPPAASVKPAASASPKAPEAASATPNPAATPQPAASTAVKLPGEEAGVIDLGQPAAGGDEPAAGSGAGAEAGASGDNAAAGGAAATAAP
jgi:polyisoprenyl-teichoic acid--peptidoglycan teichoic acid transferase